MKAKTFTRSRAIQHHDYERIIRKKSQKKKIIPIGPINQR